MPRIDPTFLARLKERTLLTAPNSGKETWHLVLDLTGSNFQYAPGDCLVVHPTNADHVVERTLDAARCSGEERIKDPKTNVEISLKQWLIAHANVTQPNRGTLKKLLRLEWTQRHPIEARSLEEILQDRSKLGPYLDKHELWDLLELYPIVVTPQEFADLVPPMLPRFYSIASAMSCVGEEVHLTVRHLHYTAREIRREGVCTDFLCYRAPLNQPVIPVTLHTAQNFSLPEDPSTPLIMIGPGTGVAPYRAFLQERIAQQAPGAHWLFFGEWTKRDHFLYQSEWKAMIDQGYLRLATAFSREGAEKVYVHHRLQEHAQEVWQWLERGAHFYVCGDAKRMAKDVERQLAKLIAEQGKQSDSEARAYLRALRKAGRYQTDVY